MKNYLLCLLVFAGIVLVSCNDESDKFKYNKLSPSFIILEDNPSGVEMMKLDSVYIVDNQLQLEKLIGREMIEKKHLVIDWENQLLFALYTMSDYKENSTTVHVFSDEVHQKYHMHIEYEVYAYGDSILKKRLVLVAIPRLAPVYTKCDYDYSVMGGDK